MAGPTGLVAVENSWKMTNSSKSKNSIKINRFYTPVVLPFTLCFDPLHQVFFYFYAVCGSDTVTK